MNSVINGIKRQVCEVWSRVVGYWRPVDKWNKGKKEEFKDRKVYGAFVKDECCKKKED